MTQKEILSEFIDLCWEDKNYPVISKEIVLGEYIIARLSERGCVIHYLGNGNSMTIPKGWLDLFSALNVHSGAKLTHLGNTGDKVDRVIYLMHKIVLLLEINRGWEVLNNLGEFAELGTRELREWLKTTYDISLGAITFTTVDNIIEI